MGNAVGGNATSFRFVDLDSRQSLHKQFVARKRSPGLTEQFLMCLTIILTSVAMILMIHNQLGLIAVLFTMVGVSTVYVTSQTNRSRELLHATEFQNALFASALIKDARFCLITGRDGVIVYLNPEFVSRFPNMRLGNNIREWLTQGNSPPADSERVIESIGNDTDQKFPISIKDCDGQKLSLLLSVEPIVGRLSGFMLLRASQTESR